MKRRFIAGAKCPKCQATDRIILINHENDEWIECIECDYTDRRPTKEDLQHIQQEQLSDEVGIVRFQPRQK